MKNEAVDIQILPAATRMLKRRSGWFLPVSLLAGLALWQVLFLIGWQPAYILPGPFQVAARFWVALMDGSLLRHTLATLEEVLLGLLAGSLLATSLGYLIARSPTLERLLSPYLVASQAVPVVAIAPLLVIWFGPGLFSKVLICALIVFFPVLVNTVVGLRAVPQNRRMAAAMGIRTGRVDALTFGLGSGIAGLAGVALSQIDNVSPNLGQSYIIDSFLVVVFGGVGNLWGTLVGAMSIGMANKLLEPFAGAVLGKIVLLIAIIFFIQKRPRGLFALKGRAVEA